MAKIYDFVTQEEKKPLKKRYNKKGVYYYGPRDLETLRSFRETMDIFFDDQEAILSSKIESRGDEINYVYTLSLLEVLSNYMAYDIENEAHNLLKQFLKVDD